MNNNTQKNEQNTTINLSLEPLITTGTQYTKSDAALYEAAYDVAQKIIEAAPVNVDLPRGYEVIYISSNVGGEYFLQNNSICDGHTSNGGGVIVDAKKGYYLHGDYNSWIDKAPKSLILLFAKDIREGLLEEISDFLEKKAEKQFAIAEELQTRV